MFFYTQDIFENKMGSIRFSKN